MEKAPRGPHGRRARNFFGTIGLVLLVAVALHLANALRFDLPSFDLSAERLLERSRRVRDTACPAYEREVLASLPPNEHNGTVVHLADMLDAATAHEMPAAGVRDEGSDVLIAWEFDVGGDAGLAPARGLSEVEVRNGALRVAHDADDWLASSEPLARRRRGRTRPARTSSPTASSTRT
jgi:hypothetical protein